MKEQISAPNKKQHITISRLHLHKLFTQIELDLNSIQPKSIYTNITNITTVGTKPLSILIPKTQINSSSINKHKLKLQALLQKKTISLN